MQFTRLVPLGCRLIDVGAPASLLISGLYSLFLPSIAPCWSLSLGNCVKASNADHLLSEQAPIDSAAPAGLLYRLVTPVAITSRRHNYNIDHWPTPLVHQRRQHHSHHPFISLVHGSGGVQSLLPVFVAVKAFATDFHSTPTASLVHREKLEDSQSLYRALPISLKVHTCAIL